MRMMHAVGALVAAWLTLLTIISVAAAPAETVPAWTVDVDQSRVGFTATQLNAPFDGTFSDFTADIAFDPANLENSHARVEIAIASIDTGNAERDAAARSADWFDAEAHPTAIFEATAFEALGDDRFAAAGTLTLRGQTRPVVLPFTLTVSDEAEGKRARAAGQIDIDRTDYGVGQGQWSTGAAVGTRVSISIVLTATREP